MPEASPLVSIVIPTYNNGEVISQAVDCCLNQTYKNIEIIVVDDGSQDGTQLILEEKYANHITYLHQENRGAGGARNTGLLRASGKYLQFLDADDLLDPDKIRIQVEQLVQIHGIALSYCDYARCDIEDASITYSRTSPRLQDANPMDDIIFRWESELSIPVHCFLFDAALFRNNGILFDEALGANEDWECWLNIFTLSPVVVFVDKVLAYYRVRNMSRCSNRRLMRKSYLEALDKHIRLNSTNPALREKLVTRKRQIKYLYRDQSPLVSLLGKYPSLRDLYMKALPWRVQRLFD